ncbi:glycerophosphoryl diester phosphodiesterase [Motilibacter peucedani]|uniref:glycerophosphodiester phosphodiesterase n=1 Tax=Motilibacter peucedani TaxID=598650 RepID=A0A420XQZ1_9ACTN|nr:glycerophosphodiester phosphodiesterase [Motilibacter peucedani]RKS75713.1 glycerophosphoryl diester phosphodiesterase [Motilibacter peucedani]
MTRSMPRLKVRLAAGVAALAAVLTPVGLVTSADAGQNSTRTSVDAPLIFGHRGASGYRPEHTLASYDLAVRMGADVIEPDLVTTKDHVLVVRHEPNITSTTDVAQHPEFASLQTTKTIDGVTQTGWFTQDFTYAQLQTLRAVERLPDVREHNTILDGRYQIPTLQQVIDFAKRESRIYHRDIGIAPETKHPTYFASIGLPLEPVLVDTLRANRLDKHSADVYVQSFEEANLRALRRTYKLRVHLVQLTSAGPTARPWDHVASGNPETYAQMTTPAGLREIATYADWLGPDKAQVFPLAADGSTGAASPLVRDAHAAGVEVVPYTVRPENQFLPAQDRIGTDPNAYGDVLAEYSALFAAGVDGLFSDTPDLEFAAREDFLGYSYGLDHPEAKVQ